LQHFVRIAAPVLAQQPFVKPCATAATHVEHGKGARLIASSTTMTTQTKRRMAPFYT
jgi:hypothetical protein